MASGLSLVLAALATYAVAGGREPAEPAAVLGDASPLTVLGTIGSSDAVVTVRDGNQAGSVDEIVVVHENARAVERVSGAQVRDALGDAADGWPSISLVAVQPPVSHAVFLLENPAGSTAPRVAVYDWRDGTVVKVVDPCDMSLNDIDVYQYCPLGSGFEAKWAPGFGDTLPFDQTFVRCLSSGYVVRNSSYMTCEAFDGQTYLMVKELTTDDEVTLALGPAPVQAPIVVDGAVYVNSVTTEGDPVLLSSEGVQVEVGGGPVQGVAKVHWSLLVVTSSDRYGAQSTYGHKLGLWTPSTDEFRPLDVPLADGVRIGAVAVNTEVRADS